MHRHGYQGRKFGRESAARKALMKGLADSLVLHESIETTLPKAKELVPYLERLIGKAKKGDLSSRRQVINGLNTLEAAHKLTDNTALQLTGRNSGYLRIKPTTTRQGDGVQLARISFVDDLKAKIATKQTPSLKTAKSAPATSAAKRSAKARAKT